MHVNPTGPSPLSYDEWRAKLELLGARYHPTGVDRPLAVTKPQSERSNRNRSACT
jgi:hypothetical protein